MSPETVLLAQCLCAALVAGVMTFLDLDQRFYVAPSVKWNLGLNAWWFGFVLINAGLSVACYLFLKDKDVLSGIDSSLRGAVAGLGDLALVRSQLVTVGREGQEKGIGFDYFYQLVRGYFLKRINEIAVEASLSASRKYANEKTLPTLHQEALLRLRQDMVFTEEEKRQKADQVKRTAEDANRTEHDRRIELAYFILSGFRT